MRVFNDASLHTFVILKDDAAETPVIVVHVDDRGVIEEVPAAPFAAGKACAAEAKAVVHAAIVTDVLTPIAFMEEVAAVGPTPVAGSPDQTGVGRWNPCAGNPVKTIQTEVPVTGRPDQIRGGRRRLHFDRQFRRRGIGNDGLSFSNRDGGGSRGRFRRNPPHTVPNKGSSAGGAYWDLAERLLCGSSHEDNQRQQKPACGTQ